MAQADQAVDRAEDREGRPEDQAVDRAEDREGVRDAEDVPALSA